MAQCAGDDDSPEPQGLPSFTKTGTATLRGEEDDCGTRLLVRIKKIRLIFVVVVVRDTWPGSQAI